MIFAYLSIGSYYVAFKQIRANGVANMLYCWVLMFKKFIGWFRYLIDLHLAFSKIDM